MEVMLIVFPYSSGITNLVSNYWITKWQMHVIDTISSLPWESIPWGLFYWEIAKTIIILINIFIKEDIAYHVTIGYIPHCTCMDFTKTTSQSLEKKGEMGVPQISLLYVRFMCKMDYKSDKFTHLRTPTTRSCNYLNLQVL